MEINKAQVVILVTGDGLPGIKNGLKPVRDDREK